jgi:1,2-diacylglycerol 3-alpha-glucosyltransferase
VLHAQGHFFISRSLVKANRDYRIPLIITNHFMSENLVHYIPLPSLRSAISRWIWNDFARIFNKADAVTTPTESAADLIRPHIKQSIKAISCGIDTALFTRMDDAPFKAALKNRYGIPDKPILLYVGRLDKEKNLAWVIEAFAKARRHNDIRLVLVGKGMERSNLEAFAEKLGVEKDVIFCGFVPDEDLPKLYCLGRAFVMAGTAELQSIVTMEAMATGLPVIAVRAGALPELVQDGVNGFLFEAGDTEMLAGKINTLLFDDARRTTMAEKSIETARAHELSKTVGEFKALYTAVLASTQAPDRCRLGPGS